MTKLLSRTAILNADFFTVYDDTIELKNDTQTTYKSALRKPSVGIFPVTEENEIYLIDQYRYLLDKRILEAASGMIDEGEEPIDAAVREMKEELGIEAKEVYQLIQSKSAGSIITWDQYLFVARGLKIGEQELEESEDIKITKMPISEAVGKVMNGEIMTASSIVGVLMIDKLLQEGKL